MSEKENLGEVLSSVENHFVLLKLLLEGQSQLTTNIFHFFLLG